MARLVPSGASLRYMSSCLRSQPIQCSSAHIASQQRRLYSQIGHNRNVTNTHCAILRPRISTQIRCASAYAKDAIYKEFTLDEALPTKQVQLKNSDGTLAEPQALRLVLAGIDRDVQVVKLLSHEGQDPISIVEVVDKETLKGRLKVKEERAAQQAKQRRQNKLKQLELNWAISGNDLKLKLKQLRDFLEKGRTVEVMLASKKRQRKATPEEAQNVVKEIRRMMGEMKGVIEKKPMEGQIGGQAMITLMQVNQKPSSPAANEESRQPQDEIKAADSAQNSVSV